MKRRMWLAVTAVMAASIAGSAGMAAAAATNPLKLSCKLKLAAMAPQGTNVVDQPPSQGSQFGAIHCRGLGSGIEATSFNVPDSGNTVGKYTQYFPAGSVKGTFNLTPQEADFSSTNFTSDAWQGTVKVTGGTGVYRSIKGKKVGTMKCTSTDSVHLACTEKVNLKSL